MKNYLLMIFLYFSCIIAGEFAGNTIFGYSNQSIGGAKAYSKEGFDISRVYLQYTDNLSDEVFIKIRYDIDRPSKSKQYGYLKNAYVDWSCDTGGIFSIGLLGTNSYGIQEKNWGHRFVAKSVPDQWKLTNTADYGIGYSHSFGMININAQLLNGDGYAADGNETNDLAHYLRVLYGESNIIKNDGFNIGIVATDAKLDDIIDNDIKEKFQFGDDFDFDNSNPITLNGFFTGLSKKKYRFGIEYNLYKIPVIKNSYNTKEKIKTIVSAIYINYNISKWNLFARQDVRELKKKLL